MQIANQICRSDSILMEENAAAFTFYAQKNPTKSSIWFFILFCFMLIDKEPIEMPRTLRQVKVTYYPWRFLPSGRKQRIYQLWDFLCLGRKQSWEEKKETKLKRKNEEEVIFCFSICVGLETPEKFCDRLGKKWECS